MWWYLGFLFFWILLVVVFNVIPKKRWLHRLKFRVFVLELFFNEWRVFSPSPVKSDLRLYYRDLLHNGETTSLKEVMLFSRDSFMSHRERLFLSKVNVSEYEKNNAYNMLLNYIRDEIPMKNVKSRQICIVRYFGFFTDKEKSIEVIDYIKC